MNYSSGMCIGPAEHRPGSVARALTQACLILTLAAVTGGSHLQAAQDIPEGWLVQAYKQIEDSEYEINWQESVRAFQSPNRAQNLRFTSSVRRILTIPVVSALRLMQESLIGSTAVQPTSILPQRHPLP